MSKLAILNFLGRTIYHESEPPPKVRSRPLEVICVGLPRSGTESLQVALLKLGYDYTYHGWDIIFEEPNYMQAWCRLAQKKWHGRNDGESNISRDDFDGILGDCAAVTDAAASVFAAEMIRVYPEAKVVLNVRRDLDAWHRSAVQNLCAAATDSWSVYLQSWLTSRAFWTWMAYERLLWPLLFTATDDSEGALSRAIRRNGKWIHREHCSMIRGMVPKENLLEWSVEDGWEPLCKVKSIRSRFLFDMLIESEFLGRPVPDQPFPKTNNAAGFAERVEDWFIMNRRKSRRNLAIIGAVFVVGMAVVSGVITPGRVQRLLGTLR